MLPALLLSGAGSFGSARGLQVEESAAADLNPIQIENTHAGTSAWRIGNSADDATGQIKGYPSATSVNRGGNITFNVTVNPAGKYTIDLYRLGCYPDASGTCLGGRHMAEIGPYDGITQPPCAVDGAAGGNTGLTECNWTGPTFTVPATWTSGVYVALLTNAQNFQNYIPFVVRDDVRKAPLLYQLPVTTYQAYNNYPYHGDGNTRNGKSLYDNASGGAETIAGPGRTRAVKVSFDRPYGRDGVGDLLDANGWSWDGYYIRWMEKSGYDVSYITNIDVHADGGDLLNHRGFLSVGHDEYWSKEMFDAAEAARDAGVNLAFFGANDVYWQVRFEPSSSGVPNRVMVAYKNTPNNTFQTMDPIADPKLRTVRFQDPPVDRPSQTLLGVTFLGSTARATLNSPYVPTELGSAWLYDGSGYTAGSSTPNIVGYEADSVNCQYAMPVHTGYAIVGRSPFTDSANVTADSHATLYQAPSGAWVFASGNMSWSWALDRSTGGAEVGLPNGWVDERVQRTTANILDVFTGVKAARPIATNIPACVESRLISFESGSLTGTNGADRILGTVALESANPIKGAYSMRIPGSANSYASNRITAVDDLNVSLSVRLNALPASDIRLALVTTVSANTGTLIIRSNGQLCLKYGNLWSGGVASSSCSTPLAPNTTYRVGLHQIRGTGTDAVLEGFLATGNAAFGAPFAKMTTGTWTLRADRVDVGSTTNVVFDAVIDDIRIDGVLLTSPAAPTGLSATPLTDETQVDLQWADNSTTETSYVVERSLSSSFDSFTSVTLPSNATSYRDTAVTMQTTYYYRVRTVNAVGTAVSGVVSATTRPAPPAAPTNLTRAAVSPSETRLDWTDNSGNETGFVVQRSGDAGFGSPTSVVLPADATTYTDKGLPSGVYYYRVRAFNIGTNSLWSNAVRGPRIKDITFEDGTVTLIHAITGVDRNPGNSTKQESASPIKGSFSAKVTNLPNVYVEQSFGPADDIYVSFYFRLTSRPTADNRIAQVLNTGATLANLWLRLDGTLCLKYGNAWSGGTPGPSCTTLARAIGLAPSVYRIGIHQRRGDGVSNALVEAYLAVGDAPFGAAFASASVAPTSTAYWQTQANVFRLGSALTSTALDAVFDDIKLDSVFMPVASTP